VDVPQANVITKIKEQTTQIENLDLVLIFSPEIKHRLKKHPSYCAVAFRDSSEKYPDRSIPPT
jgi:DNA integrity scanning protein DisA with diadenylate cyclase activity